MVPIILNPEYMNDPTRTPVNRDVYTSLVASARIIVITGGKTAQIECTNPITPSCIFTNSLLIKTISHHVDYGSLKPDCQYCFFIKNRYKPSSIPLTLPHVSESTAILGKNRIIQLVITVYTNIFSHDKKNIYRLFSPPFLIENHTKRILNRIDSQNPFSLIELLSF